MIRVVKPKNQRAKRALEKRAPKLVENTKSALLFKGRNTSKIISDVLLDLHLLKKPYSKKLSRLNPIVPFEDQASLEFLTGRNDCSLFAMGSHSKKRPHNLVMGRSYDGHVLDLVEFGVEKFVASSEYKVTKQALGSKPSLIFVGPDFENNFDFVKLKNLFLDFFRGPVSDLINLAGLDHVLVFTALEGKVLIRHYSVLFKKSGTKLPRVELEEAGPSIDLTVRRSKWASDDLFKTACRQPKASAPKKVKNISRDEMDGKLGRVHMHRQDYSKLQTRKLKGLKRSRDRNQQWAEPQLEDSQSLGKRRRPEEG